MEKSELNQSMYPLQLLGLVELAKGLDIEQAVGFVILDSKERSELRYKFGSC